MIYMIDMMCHLPQENELLVAQQGELDGELQRLHRQAEEHAQAAIRNAQQHAEVMSQGQQQAARVQVLPGWRGRGGGLFPYFYCCTSVVAGKLLLFSGALGVVWRCCHPPCLST